MNRFDTTVIIPTKNRKDFLKRAVESVKQQTLKPQKIIVVDDASGDQNYSFLINDDNTIDIEIVLNSVSKGGSFCRNIGISKSITNYVSFLDDDDAFDEDYFLNLAIAAKNNRNEIAFYASKRFVLSSALNEVNRTKHANQVVSSEELLRSNAVGTTSCVTINLNLLGEIRFDSTLPALQDYEFWLNICSSGQSIVNVPNAFVIYTIHNNKSKQISGNYSNHIEAVKLIKNKYSSKLSGSSLEILSQTLARMELKAVHRKNYIDAQSRLFKLLFATYDIRLLAFLIPYRILNKLGIYTS